MDYGVAGIKHHRRQIFFLGILKVFGNSGDIRHMAGLAGIGILLAGPGDTGVTAGTFGIALV